MPARGRGDLLIFGPLVLSWIVAVTGPALATFIPWRDIETPVVPFVGTIPWTRQTDVMSSVPGLFMVLLCAAASVAIAEVAKAFLGRRPSVFLAISIYQMTLALDIMRAYAPDWWVFLTYFLGFRSKSPLLFPQNGTPWIALVALLGVLLFLVCLRARSDGSATSRSSSTSR